ncbi:MAG: triose-phosphate isomerase [Phycisphaerae bacterium]
MSRKLFIAGNWKMNTSSAEGVELAKGLAETIGLVDEVEMAVAPPFVYLAAINDAVKGTNIGLSAQNVYTEDNGAFTGEVSTAMLKDVGCEYVILGHSERRHVIGETNELINKKVLKALADGLHVILCVGELLEEREAGKTTDVVTEQVKIGLEGVSADQAENLTIAYEPVWAIGTGKTASPDQAQEVHAMIRGLLRDKFGDDAADNTIRIQYGGSVKPGNAAELLGQPDVDGALVGGAALKVDSFTAIVQAGLNQ